MVPPTERRNEIQWLRALAAFEVVVCHSDLVVKHFADGRIIANPYYEPVAGAGVELFFIVSGYIMCMRAPSFGGFGAFITARVMRILPMYWLFTSLVVVVGLLAPAWRLGNFGTGGSGFVLSYLMLPQWDFPLLGVGWTLEYEMVFYVTISLLMLVGATRTSRLSLPAYVLAALGCIGCAIGPRSSGSALSFHIFSPYMFAFAAGWLARSTELLPGMARLRHAAAFAAIFLAALWIGPEWGDRLLLRIGAGMAVFCLFQVLRSVFQADTGLNRAVWLVGDASFSLYLSHWFVLSGSGKLLAALGAPAFLETPARLAACLASVAVAILFFRTMERPFNRWLRRGGQGILTRQPALPGQ